MPLKFKTSVSSVNGGEEQIRGKDLHELIRSASFVDAIYLILRGEMPSPQASKMFGAMLTAMIDHGPGVSSALTARVVQSAGNELHTGVAAGILALGGTRHGGALGGAAKFFAENIGLTSPPDPLLEERVAEGSLPLGGGIKGEGLTSFLKKLKKQKVRVPGYGHKVLTHDNRCDTLFGVAKETGFYGKYCEFALTIGAELNKISSKPLPLNMDGANAAILLDMGFDYKLATGLFLIGRTPGLVAQVYEEMNSGEGIRRLDEEEIEYII